MKKTSIPANLPANAIGFIATHCERPERLALYRADGTMSNAYGAGDTLEQIAAAHSFLPYSLTVEGFLVAR